MPLKILTVDDHEVTREGLKQLLSGTPLEIGGALPDSDGVLALLDQQEFGAVLVDVRMPGVDGLKLLEKIRESHADLPVLMVSAYENPTYVARAVALGANDYVLKSEAGEKIVAAINLAVKGHPPLAGGLWHRIRSLMQSGEVPSSFPQQTPLTSREVQVFRHIGLGLSNREIARSLQISVETVKEHVQHLLRKVDASDRTEAAVNAVRFGLINY